MKEHAPMFQNYDEFIKYCFKEKIIKDKDV